MYIINKKTFFIMAANEVNVGNPDYDMISDDDARAIMSGKMTGGEYFQKRNGLPVPKEPEALEFRDTKSKPLDWTGRVPMFKDAQGRKWVDRGWLEAQKFDVLCVIAQEKGRTFSKKDGKQAVIDYICDKDKEA